MKLFNYMKQMKQNLLNKTNTKVVQMYNFKVLQREGRNFQLVFILIIR